MKYFAFILILLLSTSIFAQTPHSNVVYGIVQYDNTFYGSVGTGQQVKGNIWSFESIKFGKVDGTIQQTSTETALAYIIQSPVISDHIFIGPILGPNVDWLDKIGDGQSASAYITGAAGIIAGYIFDNNLGFVGFCKRRFSLEKNAFENTYAAGGGLIYTF